MKSVTFYCILTAILMVFVGSAGFGQKALAPEQKAAIDDFKTRVNAYSKLRSGVEAKLTKLPEKASKEQIQAYKDSFQLAIRAARPGAKQGDVLTPAAADAIRYMISTAYVGEDRRKLRETIFEAENTAVPVRANSTYPEAAEILETPPMLLLTLPQLPKDLKYRFVAGKLLLMDQENLLIVDYMPNAVP